MQLSEYRFELAEYEGPLDLLLYLVRRHEVDICSLSLSHITQQFQDYLNVLKILDFEFVGDFVVTASTLLEIKSREVLPVPEEDTETDEVEEDTSDLITRLLEYRRYKDAAAQLEQRADEWLERYPRLSDDRPSGKRDRSLDRIREVELWDLVSALARIVKLPEVEQETSIKMDETPMRVHQQRIRERLQTEERVPFSDFFLGEKLQARIVGIFQAILELIRHEGYRAEQPQDFGEIWVLPPLPDDDSHR